MLWFGFADAVKNGASALFKNILCYGSAELLYLCSKNIDIFKNILCYGSAVFHRDNTSFEFIFKNILCYGSAPKLIGDYFQHFDLKTSYVMVRPP